MVFNTGQILGLLAVEASDGFNRKECVVCTNMTAHMACTCMFVVQLPSVLSDVCGLAGLLLKKWGKYPTPMYVHYIFLPDSISMPYFCSTFQIKYVDPSKGCPVKWTVCSLGIYFWFDKMVKCSFYVIFKKFIKCLFLNKTFCVVYCMNGNDICTNMLIYVSVVAQLDYCIHLCFHLVCSDKN